MLNISQDWFYQFYHERDLCIHLYVPNLRRRTRISRGISPNAPKLPLQFEVILWTQKTDDLIINRFILRGFMRQWPTAREECPVERVSFGSLLVSRVPMQSLYDFQD